MTVAFVNIGATEFAIIFIVLALTIAVANYGKDTALGYWGSLVLSLLTSPVIAFIVIFFLKRSKNNISSDS